MHATHPEDGALRRLVAHAVTRTVAILSLCTAMVAVSASAEPLRFEDMSDASGMTVARLSPDGRHIAAILFDGINYGLILIDTDTLAVKKLRQGKRYSKGYWSYLKAPRDVTWADNEVITVNLGYDGRCARR